MVNTFKELALVGQSPTLVTITKGRTAGAVKKRLHILKWAIRGIYQRAHKSTAAGGVETQDSPKRGETSPITPRMEPRYSEGTSSRLSIEEGWRKKLLETALGTLEDPRVGSGKLKEIAEGLLGGWVSKEQAADSLESIIQEHMPLKWKPGDWRSVFKKPQSNKEIRRAKYAHTQRLYKLKRKDAAHLILEGRWREAYSGLDREVNGVEEYWAKVFVIHIHESEP